MAMHILRICLPATENDADADGTCYSADRQTQALTKKGTTRRSLTRRPVTPTTASSLIAGVANAWMYPQIDHLGLFSLQ